jgi:hypothetical protein
MKSGLSTTSHPPQLDSNHNSYKRVAEGPASTPISGSGSTTVLDHGGVQESTPTLLSLYNQGLGSALSIESSSMFLLPFTSGPHHSGIDVVALPKFGSHPIPGLFAEPILPRSGLSIPTPISPGVDVPENDRVRLSRILLPYMALESVTGLLWPRVSQKATIAQLDPLGIRDVLKGLLGRPMNLQDLLPPLGMCVASPTTLG